MPLRSVILNGGLVDARGFAQAAAKAFGTRCADERAAPPDPSLPAIEDLGFFRLNDLVPWRREGAVTEFAAVDPWAAEATLEATLEPGTAYRILVATRAEVLRTLNAAFGEDLTRRAAFHLPTTQPALSAHLGTSLAQGAFFVALLSAIAASFAFWPRETLIAASMASGALFAAITLFRVFLILASATRLGTGRRTAAAAAPERELATYTVIVALYREADLVHKTIEALERLDYPPSKLEILLVLEHDDVATRLKAEAAVRDDRFNLVVVPPSHPRTKPKACNYALAFATGDLVAIYDAEDRPDPEQLRQAAACYKADDGTTGCFQAHLRFFNTDENWLTRQFAIEFSIWFDHVLPGLERLGLPIPLGGTSNHFRRATLEAVGGWDAFNVTEDADLGLRLARAGLKVRTLHSWTDEEANCSLPNWVHQRSRWLKGYLQTYLVHMRDPARLAREVGLGGFVTVQLLVGGAIASALLHFVFWGLLVAELSGIELTKGEAIPPLLTSLALALFAIGNGSAILTGIAAAFGRHVKTAARARLAASVFAMPIYWFLISFASLKALYSFASRPFYWAKTRHGLTRVAPDLPPKEHSREG